MGPEPPTNHQIQPKPDPLSFIWLFGEPSRI
jgi:hypothetical protein